MEENESFYINIINEAYVLPFQTVCRSYIFDIQKDEIKQR